MIRNRKRGFTLVELLVVIMIIGVLIGIAFPAFVAIRKAARSTQCKSNLRQFALCLLNKSANSPDGAFCTGAFDFGRDGAFDQYGWVADCYVQDVVAGQLLCPSSICVGSEKLNISSSFGVGETTGSKAPPARRNVTFRNGATLAEVVSEGYNTNYASSWHMVRSEPIFANNLTVGGLKDWWSRSPAIQQCLGPLTLRQLDSGDVPAPAIPLLGCGTQGDVNQSSGTGDGVLDSNIDAALGLVFGVPVAESFNDGPSVSNGSNAILLADAGTPRNAFLNQTYPRIGEPGIPGQYLQDTRDWYAYHSGNVNLVFADGSVRSIEDVNKDGYINPGFVVDSTATSVVTGYLSSEVEANPWDVYPGVLLKGTFPTKKFEQ